MAITIDIYVQNDSENVLHGILITLFLVVFCDLILTFLSTVSVLMAYPSKTYTSTLAELELFATV